MSSSFYENVEDDQQPEDLYLEEFIKNFEVLKLRIGKLRESS